ncbi:hypothetical protein BJ508DRAFT_220153, partial [Ascobolus immersus RN42]
PASAPLHPSIPALIEPNFSPLIRTELDRLASGAPRTGGIDPDRYSAPSDLTSAYTSHSYLTSRARDLHLLEKWGKNAWLISNSQLEGILGESEAELERVKNQVEGVNVVRKSEQSEAGERLARLEGRWKRSLGGLVEVQVATETVKVETEELRRRIAERGGQ